MALRAGGAPSRLHLMAVAGLFKFMMSAGGGGVEWLQLRDCYHSCSWITMKHVNNTEVILLVAHGVLMMKVDIAVQKYHEVIFNPSGNYVPARSSSNQMHCPLLHIEC
jgi:hypothetical protein